MTVATDASHRPSYPLPFKNAQCLSCGKIASSSKLAGANQWAVPLHKAGEEEEVAPDHENTTLGEEDTIVP